MFFFNFNLIATHKEKEASYALNKTCTLSLQWSHREVTCEMNYMEVRSTTSSDWQVTFQRPEKQMPSMNVSQARKRGYTFDSRDGRLLFRTPYGQPDSLSTEVEDVPVEAVYATVFSRQNWVVLMVDLLAACSMYEGYFDDGGYMMWKTPEALYPSVGGTQIRIGLNGDPMEQLIAEKRGYIVEKHKGTVHISIPYNAEGGHRKSFVIGSLYEFYAFDLSVEQISVDRDYVDTMLQFRRTLVTPLLPCTIFTHNQTVLEEQMFTIYLGNVPEDVMLVSIQLNEQDFMLPFTNTSTYKVTEVLHPNGTHGYTLKVLFHDPVVKQKFFIEDAVLQFILDINYTLAVLPGNESYYRLASIVALFTDVSPPTFDAVCSESGIRFKLNHQPFDYLWELTIGLDVLTSDLADRRGYILSNDSQSLQLDVPLATHGYKYQDVTLKGFSGTFEILVRVRETSEVQTSCGSAVVISSSVLHQTPRKTVLPPLSNRTLYHPSFLPLYRAAGLPRHSQENAQTGESLLPKPAQGELHPAVQPLRGLSDFSPAHPITPAECFYTDPTVCCGRRIPNRLSGLKVSERPFHNCTNKTHCCGEAPFFILIHFLRISSCPNKDLYGFPGAI
uniref:ZP-domain containing protein Ig-like domain-containing protein n=1 Tax=Neolamprologus brichardi TaxID=32507 RepID=A0A3Q4M5W1_NEOBR